MAIQRGSQQTLTQIPEVTFGTTPATPTMIEILKTGFTPKETQTVLRSAQIRSHPYLDRLLYGRYVHDLQLDIEMQNASHDPLFQVMFGGTISAKALAFADAIKSMTLEDNRGSTFYNQYTGAFLTKMSVSASASDTTPVKVQFTGVAKAATLDANATLATAVTAATPVDPFIFADATLTVAAVATPVMAGNWDLTRVVDPLMLWGSRVPREFIPGDVTMTGKATIPYDDASISTQVTAFSDAALVFKFANVGASTFRTFTFAKTKLIDISRPVTTRAGLMQDIDFEGYYDTGSSTICTMTTQ